MASMVGAALGGLSSEQARVRLRQQGRTVFDNLRKVSGYIVSIHIALAGLAVLPLLLGWPALGRLLQVQALEPAVLLGTAAGIAGLLTLAHRLVFR